MEKEVTQTHMICEEASDELLGLPQEEESWARLAGASSYVWYNACFSLERDFGVPWMI